jgi:hypothetical protein
MSINLAHSVVHKCRNEWVAALGVNRKKSASRQSA